MNKTFEEGYAARLRPEEIGDSPAKYLPIFGSDKRGSSRIRIVFYAAVKFRGKSFNDQKRSGPIWGTSLPRIITRFREGEVVWAMDTQAMFSRIRLKKED